MSAQAILTPAIIAREFLFCLNQQLMEPVFRRAHVDGDRRQGDIVDLPAHKRTAVLTHWTSSEWKHTAADLHGSIDDYSRKYVEPQAIVHATSLRQHAADDGRPNPLCVTAPLRRNPESTRYCHAGLWIRLDIKGCDCLVSMLYGFAE